MSTTTAGIVLCLGDSNTHGRSPVDLPESMNRFAPNVRWPGHLARCLGPDWQVIEEGQGGRTTVHDDPDEGAHKNGLRALPVILETHKPLDVVVLMLGTNDLKARFSVSAADIALSVERLVLEIRANDCSLDPDGPKILLVAPPPIIEVGEFAEMFEGGAEKSVEFGRCYRAVAERQKTGFLDAAAHITSSIDDGIHFDTAEHRKLGQAVAKAVLALSQDEEA